VDRSRYLTFDLAEEWRRLTGEPFVFAFWALRQDALSEPRADLDIAEVFQRSRNHGTEPEALDAIATQWSPRIGLGKADIRSYLAANIHYHLDRECMGGMQLFFRYAADLKLLSAVPEIRMLDQAAYSGSPVSRRLI
jgi:chorismate dehydratase